MVIFGEGLGMGGWKGQVARGRLRFVYIIFIEEYHRTEFIKDTSPFPSLANGYLTLMKLN
jgi:hypothetical protein